MKSSELVEGSGVVMGGGDAWEVEGRVMGVVVVETVVSADAGDGASGG